MRRVVEKEKLFLPFLKGRNRKNSKKLVCFARPCILSLSLPPVSLSSFFSLLNISLKKKREREIKKQGAKEQKTRSLSCRRERRDASLGLERRRRGVDLGQPRAEPAGEVGDLRQREDARGDPRDLQKRKREKCFFYLMVCECVVSER